MKMETAIVALVWKLGKEDRLFVKDSVTEMRVSDDFKRMLKQVIENAKE